MENLEIKTSQLQYSFENFIVGKSNQLAHGVSVNVARFPGTQYNPIFIHGSAGLGKTHLMLAIANHIINIDEKARVIYVTCEAFLNEMVDAIQKNKIQKFREKYREADVLLMDDMQIISGKEGIQEEISYTFKHLLLNGKQIVAASDRLPEEIPVFNEDLKSLICGGIIAKIKIPELELRTAFIQQTILKRQGEMPAETIKYLAQKANDNFRLIEGWVIKIMAVSEIQNCKINNALINQVLNLT